MTLRSLAAAAIFALASASTAVADTPPYSPQNSAELLDLVRGCEDDVCMSYVTGAIHGIAVWSIFADKPQPFCAGENVSTTDIRDAIVNTIESTPQLSDKHPVLSILSAFGRNWPCMNSEQVLALKSARVGEVPQIALERLSEGEGRMLVLGNPAAGPDRTLRVFHDPNCAECRAFRDTADAMAARGWRVEIFPVATTVEESAGYGAIELALRDVSPEAVEALYRRDAEATADIVLASTIAAENGVGQAQLLTAIARSGAYDAVENNTRLFFSLGATGTPSWIIGADLYGGNVSADAIELLARDHEMRAAAPSPDDQGASPAEEQ